MEKLKSPGPQWRRVLKSLNAIEFVVKNGSPQAVMQMKRESHKITTVINFHFNENGIERGNAIRDKCNLIIDILTNEARLFQER